MGSKSMMAKLPVLNGAYVDDPSAIPDVPDTTFPTLSPTSPTKNLLFSLMIFSGGRQQEHGSQTLKATSEHLRRHLSI
jgi:hypothetical protein